MTKEQVKAEKSYPISIQIMKELHKQGILDDEKFEKARGVLIDRYNLVISSLILCSGLTYL